MSVCDIDFGLELKKAYEHGYADGYADGKRDAAQWVSVEERLPEEVEDGDMNGSFSRGCENDMRL